MHRVDKTIRRKALLAPYSAPHRRLRLVPLSTHPCPIRRLKIPSTVAPQKSAGGMLAGPHAAALQSVVSGLRQLAVSLSSGGGDKGKPRAVRMADNEARLVAIHERLEDLVSPKCSLPAKTALREQLRFSSDAIRLLNQQLQLASDAPLVSQSVRTQLQDAASRAVTDLRGAVSAQSQSLQGASANGHVAHAAFAHARQIQQSLAAEDAQLQGQEEALQVTCVQCRGACVQ